jgi:hypothetical protein
MLVEITSYNQLFVESQRRSIRLNSFCQLDSGDYRANWRANGKFFDCVTHALPFTALRDSFLVACRGPEEPSSVEDLFA